MADYEYRNRRERDEEWYPGNSERSGQRNRWWQPDDQDWERDYDYYSRPRSMRGNRGAFNRERGGRFGQSGDYQTGYGEGHMSSERDYGSRSGRGNWGEDYGYDQQQSNYGYSQQSDSGWMGRSESGQRNRSQNWMSEGPNRGHGPEGYKRSDERIQEDVHERLTQHGWLDARNIRVSVENGEVTLEGHVNSRDAKRMAEDTTEDIFGVQQVHNRLRVQQDQQNQHGWSMYSSGSQQENQQSHQGQTQNRQTAGSKQGNSQSRTSTSKQNN